MRALIPAVPFLAAAVLGTVIGCTPEFDPIDDDTGTPGDTTDTGGSDTTDSGGGGDTTETGGSDTTETDPPDPSRCELDFSDQVSTPEGACHLETELSCGDIVQGTLAGGRNDHGNAEYDGWSCHGAWGLTEDYAGPERMYTVFAQPGQRITAILRAYDENTGQMCEGGDMRVSVIVPSEDPTVSDRCPMLLTGCEPSRPFNRSDPDQETSRALVSVNEPGYAVVLIDGLDADSTGNYELEILCE